MDIYKILEELEKAYPEDIFPPISREEADEVRSRYPGIIDRASAAMGRHVAKVIRRKLKETDEHT